jgi:ABC-type Fe3+/spermidine/putrescine transport system ATPase subunit
MATLEISGISKSYGPKTVLADVDLSVSEGSFCAMLGPSGSGKTTLLRAVAGFVEPDTGRIFLDGRDISPVAPERRDVGVVFQSYALFPHMNVFDNVAFGLRMRGINRRAAGPRVRAMLQLVGLGDLGDRRPAQLSGGQQQRVALARALVIEPKLLLLDEPLSALDRRIREEMRAEIKRIHKETGLTTVIVTHDQEEALDLADQILLLEAGRVRQLGSPTEIYRRPADLFVADFMGSENLPSGVVVRDLDGWAVAVGDARLPLDPDESLQEGWKVEIAVQPEHVALLPLEADDPIASTDLTGTVRDLSIYGSFARATVDVGALVLPSLMLSTTARRLAPQQVVRIVIDPAGVHAFRPFARVGSSVEAAARLDDGPLAGAKSLAE